MFGFLIIGSLSPGRIVRVNHFLSIGSKHFNMSSKRKEYKVNDRAKKAALFGLACEANPATRLSIPAAMRAKGYLDVDAMDRILIQQVRRESQRNKKILLVRRQWSGLQCWLCQTKQMWWGRCLQGYHQFRRLFLLSRGGRPATYSSGAD